MSAECKHKNEKCSWFWCFHYGKCFLQEKENDAIKMADFIGMFETKSQQKRILRWWEVEIGKAKGEDVNEKQIKLNQVSKLDRKHHNCLNPHCKHPTAYLTKHHLFPRPRTEEQSKKKIIICNECHQLLHYLKSNRDLAKHYNTEKAVIGLFKEYELELNKK